jgi:hypothetical protein
MNNRFIDTICESYLNKHSVLTENLNNNVVKFEKFKYAMVDDIKDQLNDLCENDRSVYENFRRSSKLTQGIVLDRYLDLVYQSEDYIQESIQEHFHNLEKNMFDLDYIYGSEFFENIDMDHIQNIIQEIEIFFEENNIPSESIKVMDSEVEQPTLKKALYDLIIKRKPFGEVIVPILGGVFSGPGIIVGSIILSIVLLFRRKVNRSFFKVANWAAKYGSKLGKFFSGLSNSAKIRYAIFEKNTKQCYSKCGVLDQTNVSVTDYWNNIKLDRAEGTSSKFKSNDTSDYTIMKLSIGHCLTECYLNSFIMSLSLLYESYVICLKNSNTLNLMKFDSPSNVSYRDLQGTIFNLASVSNVQSCIPFFNQFNEGLDIFKDILEVVFDDKNSILLSKYYFALYESMAKVYNKIVKESNYQGDKFSRDNKFQDNRNQRNNSYQKRDK